MTRCLVLLRRRDSPHRSTSPTLAGKEGTSLSWDSRETNSFLIQADSGYTETVRRMSRIEDDDRDEQAQPRKQSILESFPDLKHLLKLSGHEFYSDSARPNHTIFN
jgi:hypothetical protein